MSRLDSFIRRLTAQRDILNHVAANLDLPGEGALMEIGLGNGRTFNHLRELFPNRRIIAFDRAMGAHASSVPAQEDLVIGEISQTAPAFIGTEAAFVHADIGTGYPERMRLPLHGCPILLRACWQRRPRGQRAASGSSHAEAAAGAGKCADGPLFSLSQDLRSDAPTGLSGLLHK